MLLNRLSNLETLVLPVPSHILRSEAIYGRVQEIMPENGSVAEHAIAEVIGSSISASHPSLKKITFEDFSSHVLDIRRDWEGKIVSAEWTFNPEPCAKLKSVSKEDMSAWKLSHEGRSWLSRLDL